MLPLDVCIDVLSLLPVGDVGVKTLVACLETTKLLRETAQIPSVWKSQYEHRYSNCDRRREDERRTALKNNWYLMFLERAKLDNVARDLLVQLVEDRQNLRRYGAGVTMIKFGMDVWDVLHLESRRPRPNAFRPLDEAEDTPQPEHSLTRTFWAKSCLEMISRAEAIDIWRDVMSAGKSDARTFERAISSLSCFLGYREGMMTERLDSLAAGFVEHAKATRLDIDPESGGYDLQQVCREICDFMHSEGFHVPRNDQSFVHVMNSFPHYFLTDKRETIPLSLMYAFTSIANRIGIDAYPVNFPGVVMGYVRPQDPNQEPLAINVATTNSSHSVGRVGSDAMPIFLTAAGFNFVPCDSKDMLLRAARNILAALMNSRPSSQIVYHSTLLLSGCIHLLLGGIDEIMPVRFIANMNIWTLDAVVLLNYLSPLLHSGRRLMENVCWEVINKKQQPLGREGRTVKYFVGMPFVHAKFSYTGFIYNWDDECNAEEAWIAQMQVNTLTRGRHQPFYNAFSEDGSQRYVAEENIIPASYGRTHVTKILEKFDNFPLYFDDVDYPSGTDVTTRQGRGRLLLSPQSKSDYPDDDAYGAAWVEHGFAQ